MLQNGASRAIFNCKRIHPFVLNEHIIVVELRLHIRSTVTTYTVVLLVFAILASCRGNGIWRSTVRDINFGVLSRRSSSNPSEPTPPENEPSNYQGSGICASTVGGTGVGAVAACSPSKPAIPKNELYHNYRGTSNWQSAVRDIDVGAVLRGSSSNQTVPMNELAHNYQV